jgi:hypothetical protein
MLFWHNKLQLKKYIGTMYILPPKISQYAKNVLDAATQQGDQIGLIFARWVIVYFGQWFENYRSSAHFWATFFHDTGCV